MPSRKDTIEQLRKEWSWLMDGEDGYLREPGGSEDQLPLTAALLDLYEAVAVTDREGYLPNSPMTMHIRSARDRVSQLRKDGLSDV